MEETSSADSKTHQRGWWQDAKIYELYIDKFAGNLRGLSTHLDYFNKLGIDCIHLLPHYPSPMDDEGYDVMDYRGVREELGTIDDLQNLCDTAHTKGIRVIVDLVLNHVSVEHPWFVEARQSTDNPKRDYFLWSDTGVELQESAKPFSDFKKSNWVANRQTNDFFFSTFKPSQADLNWDNPNVLKEILEVIDFLVGIGVDGFRLDAVAHLVKREGTDSRGLPETHQILKQLRAHIDSSYPEVVLMGEVGGNMHLAKEYFGNDDECHLVYNFELAAEILFALCTKGTTSLEEARIASQDIPPRSSWAVFLRNHDEINLRALEDERQKILVDLMDPLHHFPFNGGSDTAQRLMSALGNNEALTKEAFRQLYSLPFSSVMYYGDEIGMKNLALPAGVNDTRLAVRGTFDWDEAKKQMADPQSLWNFVAALIKQSD